MPFNIGPFELILILLIVITIFGVGKLPELGSALGQGIREFRRTTQGLDEIAEEAKSKSKEVEVE
jgi:sec-independent protein translocase protein TatA